MSTASATPARRAPPRREAWDATRAGRGVRTLAGFLRLLELDLADAMEGARHARAFDRLRAGDLQAVIVHGVYAPDELDAVVARLERHDPPFLRTEFPAAFRSWFYGQNLSLAPPDLRPYFAESERFHAQLASLFPPGRGIVERVGALLSALHGGAPVVAPPGPRAGDRYLFTTLRAHAEGGFIPPHFDNEYALRPGYEHLRTITETHFQSFVLALTCADGGGALEVYDHRCAPEDATLLSDDSARDRRPDESVFSSVSFRLPAGALILLDSGRYLHRVSPVLGARKRWTACSFLARSRDGRALHGWG